MMKDEDNVIGYHIATRDNNIAHGMRWVA